MFDCYNIIDEADLASAVAKLDGNVTATFGASQSSPYLVSSSPA